MSRVAKNPIIIPDGVNISVDDKNVTVKGSKGELDFLLSLSISLNIDDNAITVSYDESNQKSVALAGTTRSILNNMIIGVSEGFKKELELVGVGYRANNSGQKLELALGFSHNVVFEIPSEVKVETVSEKGKNPIITLSSIDNQLLGVVAAKIRSLRKPEPYKGKGIKFVGEQLRRKAGKTAAK